MRNIDKIKSMSVDELAEWFTDNEDDASELLNCKMCSYCVWIDGHFICCPFAADEENSQGATIENCKDGIKQWLLAESEG